jgi:hypothetical protein
MMLLTVCPSGSPRYRLIKGPLKDWLIANRIPAMYSARQRGWSVRSDRLPDLLALAQRDGIPVRFRGGAP